MRRRLKINNKPEENTYLSSTKELGTLQKDNTPPRHKHSQATHSYTHAAYAIQQK